MLACKRSPVQSTDEDVEIWEGQDGSVRLGPNSIWIPAGRRRHREVRYARLTRLGLTLNSDTLVLSTLEDAFRLTADKVGGVHRLVALHRSLVHRIAAHPAGDQIFAKLVRNEELDRTFMERRPNASYAFIALCVVVFAVQLAWQATLPSSMLWGNTDPVRSVDSLLMRLARIIAMGANTPGLIEAGEYYRLATANFLHAEWVHIGINLFGLFGLGPLVERIWGPWRLTVVFLLSGLTGAIASAWLTEPLVAVGVSTSLLGLLGAYFVVWLRFRSELPPRFAVPTSRWIVLALINLVIWWNVPSVDHWGHLGGALGGAAFAFVVHPIWSKAPEFLRPTTRLMKACAVALTGLFVAAGVWAASAAISQPTEEGLRRLVIDQGGRSPIIANDLAWAIATSPKVSPPLLAAAEVAARGAVNKTERLDYRAAFLDTWATTLHRLGRTDEAIRASLESVRIEPQPDTTSQLARFLQAHLRKGPAIRIGVPDAASIAITFSDGQVELTRESGLPDLLLVALVEREARLEGTLLIRYPAKSSAASQWATESLGALRHPDVTIRLGLITTGRVTSTDVALKYLTMDPQIRSLP